MLNHTSIRFFVAVKAAPWIAVFIILAAAVIVFIERSIFVEQLDNIHDSRVDRFIENKKNVLNGLIGQVDAISKNDLIINGLIDVAGSDEYLDAFVNSYVLSGTSKNSIKIVDFSGNVIASNEVEISDRKISSYKAFSDVIEKSFSHYEYTDYGMVFFSPIIWSSAAEGAVVVEVKKSDINRLFTISMVNGQLIYHDGKENVLYVSDDDFYNKKVSEKLTIMKSNALKGGDKFLDWYYKRVELDEGEVIYSFENYDSVVDKFYLFVVLGIISIFIAVAGAFVSVFLSSSVIAKTLNNFLASLELYKEGKVHAGAVCENGNEPDEIVKIHNKFNVLLKNLIASESFGSDVQSIINSLNESLVVFDKNGLVRLSNKSFDTFRELLGIGEGEVYEEIIPDLLKDTMLLEKNEDNEFECSYSLKNSGDFIEDDITIKWTRSLYSSNVSESVGFAFIGSDISLSKKVARQIKKKNEDFKKLSERFDLALKAATIGVWEYNFTKDELIWDERMHDIYQVDKASFTSSANIWIECVHPQDFEATNEALQHTIETGEDFNTEFRVIWPNNEVRWLSANARISRDGDEPTLVGVNTDITETKQLNVDLAKALDKAEELVHLKSDFLASMSHEIRTPMNGVLGMLNLLSRTELSVQQNRYAKLAHSSAESLLELINDILDFSKIDAGKLNLESIEFNLPELLGDVSESLAAKAQEKELELILDISEVSQDVVQGDPGRVRQIFVNLISNAIKFTEAGEVIVKVSLDTSLASRLGMCISVKDTGIGIPSDKIDHLFSSFSQLDASTTRKYGGTGLGLAIVKQLCELMDGDIKIESVAGQGSEFIADIIINYGDIEQDAELISRFANEDIVLVDGNPKNAKVLSDQLSLWGAEVKVLTGVNQLFSYLENSTHRQPTIVLLDNHIDNSGGVAITQKIRQYSDFETIKIVLMTRFTAPINTDDLKGLGFISSFPKPATRHDLLSMLDVNYLPASASSNNAPLIPHTDSSVEIHDSSDDVATTKVGELLKATASCATSILLAEDNIVNQEVIKGILHDFNLDVTIANNGLEALNFLNEKRYDLVLMDCQMPVMDGYEASRSIRAGKTLQPSIPIVAITANAMIGDKEKCIDAGMDDYMSKPIRPEKLLGVINQWSLDSHIIDDEKVSIVEEVTMETGQSDSDLDKVWDREEFMRRVLNNEAFADKLITLFKDDTPKTIEKLEIAINQDQVKEAGLIAHKLKGSAANLGGIELAALVSKIEHAGREEDLSQVKALWPLVAPQYKELIHRIDNR